MRLLLHLVRKELRDVRWHVGGSAIAVTLLVVATYYVLHVKGNEDRDGGLVLLWAALSAGLAGAAAAAELFAGDTTSRRVEASALLPVPLARVFAAKALASAAAAGIAGAWATICAGICAALLGVGHTAHGAEDAISLAPAVVLLALGGVLVVALFAIVLEHALGAVVCGLLAAGIAVAGWHVAVPWDDWGVHVTTANALWVSVPATAIVVVAAHLAFVHGPIHLGRRVRRAALGVGVASAVLAACGVACAAVLDARAELAPGDADTEFYAVDASPDGRTACLIVGNARVPAQSRAWLVDVASGRTTALPGTHRKFVGWTSDGGVRVSDYRVKWNRKVAEWVDQFDVATGRLRSVRSQEQLASEPWTEGWARFAKTPGGYTVEWKERGLRREFAGAWWVGASPRPGRLLVSSSGHTRVVDLDSGVERDVPELAAHGLETWIDGGRALRWRGHESFSTREQTVCLLDCDTGATTWLTPPSGRWALVGPGDYASYIPSSGTVAVANLRTGRAVAGPWKDRNVWFDRGNPRFAIVTHALGAAAPLLVDCATGRASEFAQDTHRDGWLLGNLVRGLPDGTFLFARGGCGLDVIDAEGRALRTLVEAPQR